MAMCCIFRFKWAIKYFLDLSISFDPAIAVPHFGRDDKSKSDIIVSNKKADKFVRPNLPVG